LIKIDQDAGHGGGTSIKEAVKAEAEVYAFFAKVTGTQYKI